MNGPFQAASAWTDEFLEPMRHAGDPPADTAIAALFAQGDADSVNVLMRNLVANDGVVPDSLPEAVRTFLATTEDLPPFADPARIAVGEQVFWQWGPQLVLTLLCYSLPYCYAAKKGVQVLALTSRLTGNAQRRIVETAQMLVDVLRPGGLTSPDGAGRRTLQKVRLMHAAVRHLASQSPQWNPEWDLPINQEDLAGTLMSFSWVAIDGLRKIGITLTEDQQEAYLHCWQVIGEQLGMREEMVPADLASAEALTRAVMRRQYAACPEGQLMTTALLEMMRNILPGNVMDAFPALYLEFFMGRDNAALLGVEEPAAGLLQPLSLFGNALTDLGRDKLLADSASRVSRLLINSAVLVARGGNRPAFSIPTELKEQWGVNWLA